LFSCKDEGLTPRAILELNSATANVDDRALPGDAQGELCSEHGETAQRRIHARRLALAVSDVGNELALQELGSPARPRV